MVKVDPRERIFVGYGIGLLVLIAESRFLIIKIWISERSTFDGSESCRECWY